MEVASAPGVV